MEFFIRSEDNVFNYNSVIPVGIIFEAENNNSFSDTQGYMRKAQKGQMRWLARVVLKISEDTYNSVFIPLLQYSTNVVCTFERNIPGRKTSVGTFTYEDLKIIQEFGDGEYEVEITLREVLY